MTDRRGVMFVMFDLPVKESSERSAYALFRKTLLQHGYLCFQKSVYIKLLRNISSAGQEISCIDSASPSQGSVQAMAMNLNTFKGLTTLRGEEFNMQLFSDDVVFIGDEEESTDLDDEALLKLDSKRLIQRAGAEENTS